MGGHYTGNAVRSKPRGAFLVVDGRHFDVPDTLPRQWLALQPLESAEAPR